MSQGEMLLTDFPVIVRITRLTADMDENTTSTQVLSDEEIQKSIVDMKERIREKLQESKN